MYGTTRMWSKFFINRTARLPGADPSERIHPTALPYMTAKQSYYWGLRTKREAHEIGHPDIAEAQTSGEDLPTL
jgi:hypothetical protein